MLILSVECVRGNANEGTKVCSKMGHTMAGDKMEEKAEEEMRFLQIKLVSRMLLG